MSAAPEDDCEYATVGVDATDTGRFADIFLENGEVLIYDRDEEDAWIQADMAVGLGAMA